MALEPLRIIKNWYKNSIAAERCWDEIADKLSAWSLRINNNLKQLGLDINGSAYDFNNNGVGTQTTPVVTRIADLENATPTTTVGLKNVGLDLSSTAIVRVVQADGTDVSASSPALLVINDKQNPGELIQISISSTLQLTLTGCHWGYGTLGDLADHKLYISVIDDNGTLILGVDSTGGRKTVTPADAETLNTNVNSIEKVYVTAEPSAESNCYYLGWVNADFDDTGNAGGEDYWTIQTGVGDIQIGRWEYDPNPTFTTITLGTVNLEDALVPLGSIIPFYDFDAALTFDTDYWAYCDGSAKTITGVGEKTLPDLSNRYLVGFGTEGGTDIDSAAWATDAVGQASHTSASIAHTHTGPSHTHTGPSHTHNVGKVVDATTTDIRFYGADGYGGGDYWKISSPSLAGASAGGFGSAKVNLSDGEDFVSSAAGTGATGDSGTGATGTALTTISVQPRSIRVRFIMRIK